MTKDVRKNRVKEIRAYLAAIGSPISSVQAYEVFARACGVRDANTLAGMAAGQMPEAAVLAAPAPLAAPVAAHQPLRLPQFLLAHNGDGYLDYEGDLLVLGKHVVELRLSHPRDRNENPHWSLIYGNEASRSEDPGHHATGDMTRTAFVDCVPLIADREDMVVSSRGYLWSPQPLKWAHVSKPDGICDYDSFETQLLATGSFVIDMMLVVPAEPTRRNQPYVSFMVGDTERRGENCCSFTLNPMDAAALLGGAHLAAGLD